MDKLLLIGLGGFLGANARYLLQQWAAARWGASFPSGTLIANVAGSFLLGFFLTISTDGGAREQAVAVGAACRRAQGHGRPGRP